MMPDRENVIKTLEKIKAQTKEIGLDKAVLAHKFMDEIIELLKEQEAVEPRRDANCVRMFRCGACGEYVGFIDSDPGDPNEQDNYCWNCGRAVKWE